MTGEIDKEIGNFGFCHEGIEIMGEKEERRELREKKREAFVLVVV